MSKQELIRNLFDEMCKEEGFSTDEIISINIYPSIGWGGIQENIRNMLMVRG